MRTKRNGINPSPEQNITKKNFSHFIEHQKKYIILAIILLFSIQMISNFIADKPLIIGSESYYHLHLSEQGIHYNPLVNLIQFIPRDLVFLIPLILAILSVLILFNLSKNFLDKKTTFFFILFLVSAPGFIFTFVTLSSYALFLLLVLLGFFLIFKTDEKTRYLSLLPFILATLFDLFSTLLLLVLQLIYFSKNEDKKDKLAFHAIIITAVLLISNQLIFKIPILLGPFHRQELLTDLLSDLGGVSGLGLFTVILSFIGLAIALKKKNFQFLYLLLLLVPAYLFNTNVIFYLTIIISLFAALGFLSLFERNWNLLSLKKFTVILLILGIFFSTLAYMDRISEYQPLQDDKEVLSWIKENTPKDAVVLSMPENTYMIKYFAERTPLYFFDKGSNKEKIELSDNIFSSLYVQDLFPLLGQSEVDLIYITRDMKKELPQDQGFLFLLKNERFKLIHSSGDSEVWVFENDEE